MYELSLQDIESALYCVSPVDREMWIRMGMAVKNELGEGGFDLWNAWSQQADNYQEKAARSSWKSFKPGIGPTIASLIYEAKQNGWSPKQDLRKKTQEEIEKQQALLRKKAEQEAIKQANIQQSAAQRAQQEWNQATPLQGSNHPYLQKKNIASYGLRIGRDGALLVPGMSMYDGIQTLQRIYPDGSKRFVKGGKKAGCFHWISQHDNVPAEVDIVLCEGYATAASIFEAISGIVVVCFDAGNLMPVAQDIHRAYPNNRIVIAGDNDQFGEKNTGRAKGDAVAFAFERAISVYPEFRQLESFPTDFNDLHHLEGLAEVREQLMREIRADSDASKRIWVRKTMRWLLEYPSLVSEVVASNIEGKQRVKGVSMLLDLAQSIVQEGLQTKLEVIDFWSEHSNNQARILQKIVAGEVLLDLEEARAEIQASLEKIELQYQELEYDYLEGEIQRKGLNSLSAKEKIRYTQLISSIKN